MILLLLERLWGSPIALCIYFITKPSTGYHFITSFKSVECKCLFKTSLHFSCEFSREKVTGQFESSMFNSKKIRENAWCKISSLSMLWFHEFFKIKVSLKKISVSNGISRSFRTWNIWIVLTLYSLKISMISILFQKIVSFRSQSVHHLIHYYTSAENILKSKRDSFHRDAKIILPFLLFWPSC